MISNRRYHFIIPAPEIGDRPLGLATANTNDEQDQDQSSPSSTITTTNITAHDLCGKVCPNCHDPVAQLASTCSLCNVDAVSGSILDLHTHLLHGVLHCNGFGPLLCVNGREKGSVLASGRELVDLWDRICAMLRARYILDPSMNSNITCPIS